MSNLNFDHFMYGALGVLVSFAFVFSIVLIIDGTIGWGYVFTIFSANF